MTRPSFTEAPVTHEQTVAAIRRSLDREYHQPDVYAARPRLRALESALDGDEGSGVAHAKPDGGRPTPPASSRAPEPVLKPAGNRGKWS